MHVLPRGFVRIRHDGLLANASRRGNVELCRSFLPAGDAEQTEASPDRQAASAAPCKPTCPKCSLGTMVKGQTFRPGSILAVMVVPEPADSS
jgi:hypothetical protein